MCLLTKACPQSFSVVSESRFSAISGSDAASIFMEPIHLSSAVAAKKIINEGEEVLCLYAASRRRPPPPHLPLAVQRLGLGAGRDRFEALLLLFRSVV